MNTRIKLIRKNAGLTQQAFADRIGVKQNTVALYESGQCGVSDTALKMICREFSINEQWLRTGEGDMYIPIEDETAAVVASLMEEKCATYDFLLGFARDYQKLDDASRKVIDNIIENRFNDRKEKAE